MSIESSLQEWKTQGFLTDEQLGTILRYEESKPKRNWALSGILGLGTVVVGIGFVSLVAANWWQIPDSLKLAMDFAILIGLAIGAIHFRKIGKQLISDSFNLGLAILALASIGLISQIFHTSGHLYQALVLWCAMTLPMIIFSELQFSSILWVAGFSGLLLDYNYQTNFLGSSSHSVAPFMVMPFLLGALQELCRRVPILSRFSTSFGIFYFAYALVAVVIADQSIGSITPQEVQNAGKYYGALALTIVPLLFFVLLENSNGRQRVLKVASVLMLALMVVLGNFTVGSKILAGILTIFYGFLGTTSAAINKQQKLFNFWTFFIGLRFLSIYFEAFSGLAATGFGLLFSGGLIIASALVWNKYRQVWYQKLESWLP